MAPKSNLGISKETHLSVEAGIACSLCSTEPVLNLVAPEQQTTCHSEALPKLKALPLDHITTSSSVMRQTLSILSEVA